MANLTFSKKGVPMGRNKSQADNKNSQWSAEEDNYIRMAIESRIPASTVASKLGRTEHSVKNRKWILGIEGRFPSTKRVANKSAMTLMPKKPSSNPPKGIELFSMETNVPIPSRGAGANEESRNKIRNLFSQMNVGQSFVVPRKLVHVAKYITDKEFPSFKIKTSATSADKQFHRIFRVA